MVVIFIPILHMSKQKYKEVTESAGSHRTVRLKKKAKIAHGFDSKVYRLNPEVVLLAARLVGGSGILQEGENCALLRNVHTHPVFQTDSRVRPRRQGPDLCCQPLSSSPFKFGVFSDKYKHSQQLLGWEGRRA